MQMKDAGEEYIRMIFGAETLNGGSFTTAYPARWGLTVKRSLTGFARYQLSSSGSQVSGLGIPPVGTFGITIDEAPTSALQVVHLQGASPDAAAATQSAAEMLPNVVGCPAGPNEPHASSPHTRRT